MGKLVKANEEYADFITQLAENIDNTEMATAAEDDYDEQFNAQCSDALENPDDFESEITVEEMCGYVEDYIAKNSDCCTNVIKLVKSVSADRIPAPAGVVVNQTVADDVCKEKYGKSLADFVCEHRSFDMEELQYTNEELGF